MKRLFRYFKGYEKYLILGPLFKLLEAIFELIVPLVMSRIIDTGIHNGDRPYVIRMSCVIILLGVCGLAFALTCQYFAAKCAYGFASDLRSDLYRHINSFSHAELDKLGASTLTTRIINDTNAVQTGVNMFIRLATRSPFLIIGAIIMAVSIDAKLSLIFLVAAPLIAFIVYKVMSISIPMYKNNQKRLDKISLLTGENLEGVRVIRAFSRQKEEISEFDSASDDLSVNQIAVSKISAILNPATFIIMNFAITAIIWFGGIRVNTGSLTQGEITAFVNYLTQISLSLVVFANLIIYFNKALASANRISAVFETMPGLENGTGHIDKNERISVEFRNVSFHYPSSSENAINNISFCLPAGQTLGIIGGTGSGKSTIASLIPRFYDATEGTVLINHKDIREMDISDLRKKIAVVPQKASLVSGTIAENIRTGNKDASEEDIIQALITAQAYEFVCKLPDGIHSQVSPGGRNFSGGQRQRLTIARAVAAKPDVLILDDSSSALDQQTDYNLRKAISQSLKGTSVIMISQRATSLKNSDLILVLDDGECVGAGTNDTLEKECMVYKEIIDTQKAGE
ncbi:MAG: ABC transporter ATP-binding protein [Oscillospiraceae bacterium]|nr:ABC transporter ATP-binding protein [Oscillospiraceae bacterium]